MAIALVIRGHERNAFKTKRLSDFVKQVVESLSSDGINIDIYIQTWNMSECASTWRKVSSGTPITEEDVRNYFEGITIKEVHILKDSDVEFLGNTRGNIGRTLLPKVAWKRMWYGLLFIAERVANAETYTQVINMRMDHFLCRFCVAMRLNEEHTLRLINKWATNGSSLNWVQQTKKAGIDNFYSCSPSDWLTLCSRFHMELDRILKIYVHTSMHQEFMVYDELNRMIKY